MLRQAGSVQVRVRRNANENHVLESVVRRLSRIVSTLKVQEFRETRVGDGSSNHPVEYYINEMLPRDKDSKSQKQKDQSSRQEINKDVKVMRIEDVLRVEVTRIETFATQSVIKPKSSCERMSEPVTAQSDENFMRTATIYKNDNVRVKDCLYRGGPTLKNALLYGTKIDHEVFEKFPVADRKSNGRSEIST